MTERLPGAADQEALNTTEGLRASEPQESCGGLLASGSALIELSDVWREYTVGGSTVTALEAVALCVSENEFVVVLGPSGSGKTTLLNLVGALDTPSSGRIVVAGRERTKAARTEGSRGRRHAGCFICQPVILFSSLTAL